MYAVERISRKEAKKKGSGMYAVKRRSRKGKEERWKDMKGTRKDQTWTRHIQQEYDTCKGRRGPQSLPELSLGNKETVKHAVLRCSAGEVHLAKRSWIP
jgi:hypothetical protein